MAREMPSTNKSTRINEERSAGVRLFVVEIRGWFLWLCRGGFARAGADVRFGWESPRGREAEGKDEFRRMKDE